MREETSRLCPGRVGIYVLLDCEASNIVALYGSLIDGPIYGWSLAQDFFLFFPSHSESDQVN
jgi:hypothetical protein